MLILKFFIDAVCGVLFSLGGAGFLWMRRYVMPVVIAITFSIVTHTWWLGILVLPVIGTLCIGYRGGEFLVRGAWMLLQATVIGIGAFLTHHLSWYFYVPYCLGAFVLGGTLYSLYQIIGDFIFGFALALILFLIH
jgi:hypothetical protein